MVLKNELKKGYLQYTETQRFGQGNLRADLSPHQLEGRKKRKKKKNKGKRKEGEMFDDIPRYKDSHLLFKQNKKCLKYKIFKNNDAYVVPNHEKSNLGVSMKDQIWKFGICLKSIRSHLDKGFSCCGKEFDAAR